MATKVATNSSQLSKLGVTKLSELPKDGRYGEFGGQFVPENLVLALKQLETVYESTKLDPDFQRDLKILRDEYGGRPTPLYFAKRLSEYAGNTPIFLKREDLVHGGSHKLNNVIGQMLLAKRLGKRRVVVETGAGQHGVATAMVGTMLGLSVDVYMGQKDIDRQPMNVYRMKLLGARVCPVNTGSATLKEATTEAMRDWATSESQTYYLAGSTLGPHPYPMIVRDFQRIIGDEIMGQTLRRDRKLPDLLVACLGGGSNALGTFFPFVNEPSVHFLGVEASGAASLNKGSIGIAHGTKTHVLQDELGRVSETQSIAAGLDYASVGPEHTLYKKLGRGEYIAVTDEEAFEGFRLLSQLEGIIPALESAHAIYAGVQRAKKMRKDQLIVITLSGRGDKDLEITYRYEQTRGTV
jgi:tryptophan synthase beta chain